MNKREFLIQYVLNVNQRAGKECMDPQLAVVHGEIAWKQIMDATPPTNGAFTLRMGPPSAEETI